jgi:hypothetical protein
LVLEILWVLLICSCKLSLYNLKGITTTLKNCEMINEIFITDKNGRKIAVQVPIETYRKLVADSEELEEIKEYRKAKANKSESIPFEQAFREIEEAIK